MNIIKEKFKEGLAVVLPIAILVLILNFTIIPLERALLIRFIIGVLLMILGLPIFLIGVDIGITQIGNLTGHSLARSNKFWFILFAGIIMGFIISIAEPGLHVLSGQVDFVSAGQISRLNILLTTALGIGILLAIGALRIVYNIALDKLLFVLYGLIFLLNIFASPEFLAISFDAAAATTGAMTVPFFLAVAAGIASMKKDSKAAERDSFGLVGVTATGAVLAVLIMSIISRSSLNMADMEYILPQSESVIGPFMQQIPLVIRDVFYSILPILAIFLVFQKISFNLDKKAFRTILKGLLYTLIGLILLLIGVNAGFLDVGSVVGYRLATKDNTPLLLSIGFIIGFLTILAEPSVHVLTHQIEDITSGYVRRPLVLAALTIGVGLSISLSMLRIISPKIKFWHYIIPGYMLTLILSRFTPKLFVGIAFDAGTVASGLMATTFILSFAQGAAGAVEGANVLVDAFGIVAMVTLVPLLTVQVLGLIFKMKSRERSLEKFEGYEGL